MWHCPLYPLDSSLCRHMSTFLPIHFSISPPLSPFHHLSILFFHLFIYLSIHSSIPSPLHPSSSVPYLPLWCTDGGEDVLQLDNEGEGWMGHNVHLHRTLQHQHRRGRAGRRERGGLGETWNWPTLNSKLWQVWPELTRPAKGVVSCLRMWFQRTALSHGGVQRVLVMFDRLSALTKQKEFHRGWCILKGRYWYWYLIAINR